MQRAVLLSLIACIVLLSGAFFFSGRFYEHRVLPGVHVGTIPVGGMERRALTEFLRRRLEAMSEGGIPVQVKTHSGVYTTVIAPVVITEDATHELIHVDIETAVDSLLSYERRGGLFHDSVAPFATWIKQPHVSLAGVVVDEEHLQEALSGRLMEREVTVRDASIVIHTIEPLSYDITEATPGVSYHYGEAVKEITYRWVRLDPPSIQLTEERIAPKIMKKDVESIMHRLASVFHHGGLTLSFERTDRKGQKEWMFGESQLALWIQPMKTSNGDIVFGLDEAKVLAYLDSTVRPVVDVPEEDAKFRIDANGKVVEFQGSRAGVTVDAAQTVAAIQEAFAQRTRHDEGIPTRVSVVVAYTEPQVTTAEANDLGITEILGIGTSNFSGSPANRVKNIRHAVEKLNGILVKPGEIFSTLQHAGPFTAEDGYLPELVIKGTALEPEVGGGLCQIGTTLFRMAMNSGLSIVERRNHSLVVHYYGDSRNGNPGTDATIYDPAPDFRFKNDTGHHVLVETDMNTNTGDLFFTLWGTSDGRTASYTAPIVSKWIPHGEKKIVETTKLKPGETKCQKAFPGAEASFVYARQFPDGTREERLFESYYRPLPEICLVGVLETSATSTAPEILGSLSG